MEELGQAINLAMNKFKEKHGEDAKMKQGDKFVTIFNNCVLIISLEGGHLKTNFIEGKPFYADMTLSIYGNSDLLENIGNE